MRRPRFGRQGCLLYSRDSISWNGLRQRTRHARNLYLLMLCLLLGACGRGNVEPTPTPTATDTAPTAAAEAINTPLAVVTVAPEPDVPTPAPVVATGAEAEVGAADAIDMEVEAAVDCPLESHVDLAGYTNVESIMGCPIDSGRNDIVAFNEFGPGPDFRQFMLWLSWEDLIYVLLPGGHWQAVVDSWSDEQPTYACNPFGGEPTSPPLPRRGFGKVWCENEEIQSAMGAVTVEERQCQYAVTQSFARGRIIGCFENAAVRYYQIFDDGQWAAVLQP